MASNYEIIWAEFLGNGFLAGPFDSTTVSAVVDNGDSVYDVTIDWTDIYSDTDRMIDNVGARVYLEGHATRDIPDGYYTISAATTSTVTITGIFDAAAPTTGATTGTITIEDFYKFSNGIPDFVTGESARSRWLEIISEDGISSTIGQKIGVRGGVASFDGFSIDLNFVDDSELSAANVTADTTQRINAFKRIARSIAEQMPATDDASVITSGSIAYDASTITKKRTTDLNAAYISTNSTYNFVPAVIDREAIIITGSASPGSDSRDLSCRRGVLGTGNGSTGSFHTGNSIVYSGIQMALGATCRVKSIPVDATAYDFKFVSSENQITNEGLIYRGVVENVVFNNNLAGISFELSPLIFSSIKNSFGPRISANNKILVNYFDAGTDETYPMVLLTQSPTERIAWKWVKVNEDVAVKIRFEKDAGGSYDPDLDPTLLAVPSDGLIGWYGVAAVIDTIVWDPGSPNYNDNYVILTPSDDAEDWYKKSRNTPRFIELDEEEIEGIERYVVDYGSLGARGRDNVQRVGVRFLDRALFLNADNVDLCHVFEPAGVGFASFPVEIEAATGGCYVAKITIAELLLQILTSLAGDGANGPFDVLPYGIGLGLTENDIDWASFGFDIDTNVFNLDLSSGVLGEKIAQPLRNAVITPKDTDDIKKWLDKLLVPYNLGLVQNSIGKISLIDTTHLVEETITKSLQDSDLAYDHGGNNYKFDQSYDGKNLYSAVTIDFRDITRVYYRQKRLYKLIPAALTTGDYTDGGAYSRVNTYINSTELEIKADFAEPAPIYEFFGEIPDSILYIPPPIVSFATKFINVYSKILPTITCVADETKFDVGDKITFDVNNAISVSGGRGFTGFGIVVDKKTNIFARQSIYKIYALGDQLLEFFGSRVWSSSAVVTSGGGSKTFNVEANEYVPTDGTDIGTWTNDSDSFAAGDSVLLYDENFVLLSVDAGGNADPKKIQSATSTSITLVTPFTDGAGATITPSAGDIVMHAKKSIQTNTTTQSNLAWMQDDFTRW